MSGAGEKTHNPTNETGGSVLSRSQLYTGRVPVRTSAVVAGGLALLAIVGMTTIFGESLLAMFAPPQSELATGVRPKNVSLAPPSGSTTPRAGMISPAPIPSVAPDGGRDTTPAGNSTDGNS